MPERTGPAPLGTEALVLGYAMSRLDEKYLAGRDALTWREAFREASLALGRPWTTFKNLRDEFDPLHDNSRRGWHKRGLRADRLRVAAELSEISDAALGEFAGRILRRDSSATEAAIESLATPSGIAQGVAKRLLTGRRAEEYFREHSCKIVGIDRGDLLDLRDAARGFDFGVRSRPETAIEVKGLQGKAGDIQMTDREWAEARARESHYWLVVVGNLGSVPAARVFPDPAAQLRFSCRYQRSVTAAWRSRVSVAP